AAPTVFASELRFPVGAVLSGLQRLHKANSRINGAIDAPRPFLGGILQPELDRIDLQLGRNLVHDLFAGKRRLRGARGAVSLSLRLVVEHVIAIDLGIWELIAAEDAHRAGADHAAG